tara:strand:+ start:3727 stop:4008 length:282 start_codon:yes stop_codon:yes gene_type:complete
VKGNNTYQRVWRGNSGVAMVVAEVKPAKDVNLMIFTASAVTEILGVCTKTLLKCLCGGLKFVEVVGRIKYSRNDIEDYIEAKTNGQKKSINRW